MTDRTHHDGPHDPATGKFRKGVTGNPKGRPRKTRTVDDAVLGAMNKRVPVTVKGRRQRITMLEATATQIANRGAQGDPRSAKMALDLAQRAEDRRAAAPAAPETLSASDAEIAQRFVDRIRRIAIETYLEEIE